MIKNRWNKGLSRAFVLILSILLAVSISGVTAFAEDEQGSVQDQTVQAEEKRPESGAEGDVPGMTESDADEELPGMAESNADEELPGMADSETDEELPGMTESDADEELPDEGVVLEEELADEAAVTEEEQLSPEEAEEEPASPEEAEDVSEQPTILDDGTQITTRDELQTALEAGGTVIMTQDISSDPLYISSEATLDLNGYILRCEIHVSSGGSLTLTDSCPEAAHENLTYKDPFDQTVVYDVAGGAIAGKTLYVDDGGELIMEAGTITGDRTGALEIRGSAVMTGGTIAGNRWCDAVEAENGSLTGGPVSVIGDGIFTMKDGIITCNAGYVYNFRWLGSVFVAEEATFNMEGGSITNNISGYGGGVCAYYGGTFNMTGGEISGNRACIGGGVHVFSGTFNMQDGVIADNTALEGGGGISSGGRFRWSTAVIGGSGTGSDNEAVQITIPIEQSVYMSGGSITGNVTDASGGGISIGGCTHFEMSGDVSVTDNAAGENGGGICLDDTVVSLDDFLDFGNITVNVSHEIKLEGGYVSGNTAVGKGGGIYMPDVFNETIQSGSGKILYTPESWIEVSGELYVQENTSGEEGAKINDNLYLLEGAYLSVAGDMTGSFIGVTTEKAPTESEPVVFTSGLSGNGTDANFVSDDQAYRVMLNPAKEACLGIPNYVTTHEELSAALAEGGTVVMTQDISGDVLYISSEVTLDLNGYILRCEIHVSSDGSLTLTDSFPEAAHDNLTYKDPFDQTVVYEVAGGAVAGDTLHVESGGELIMEAGTITGASGALEVKGSFVMTGGTIAGNTKGDAIDADDGTWVGGSVSIVGRGTFTMQGGTITCNAGRYWSNGEYDMLGSVCVAYGGTFTMEGGSITKNLGGYGGGVCAYHGGTFTMLDGEISGNKASYGGGVCVYGGTFPGIFDMQGGVIADNTALHSGGGVDAAGNLGWNLTMLNGNDPLDDPLISPGYSGAQMQLTIPINSYFYMSGGSITGNRAGDDAGTTGSGGGISIGECAHFEMSGEASVTDNTAGQNGGGIFVFHGTLQVPAEQLGFGRPVFYIPKEIMLAGGYISGNTAGEKGGGIYMSNILIESEPLQSSIYDDCVLYPPVSTLEVSGETFVSGNTSGTDGALINDNFYLCEGVCLPITGDMTGSLIGVTTEAEPTEEENIVFTSGLSGNGTAANFFSDSEAYRVRTDTENEAYLCIAKYDITIGDHTNGSITTYVDGSPALSEIRPGTPVTVEAVPDQKYELDKLSYTGADGTVIEISAGEDGAYSFLMPRTDMTLTAEFSLMPVKPEITTQPQGITLTYGYGEGSLLCEAGDIEDHVLSYQWYSNTVKSNEGGKKIKGATDAAFTIPSGLNKGSYYYYCVVTATRTDNNKSAATVSDAVEVTVKAKEVTPAVTLSKTSYTYNGSAKTPGVTVKDGPTVLKKDTDYKVTYASGRINAGTYKVTVDLKGNYSGSKTVSFKINAKEITPAVTLSKTAYTYNGSARTPGVTVKDGSKVLTKNTDYTVTYASGRKNVGTYKVTVKLKGNYSGSKTVSFKINPKGTSIESLTAGTKKMVVKWNQQATQTTGYQIQYSRSSEFATGNKTVNIASRKSTSKTVKELKTGKKYYVRIRTYKTVNGKTYYSGWSKKKSVTVK